MERLDEILEIVREIREDVSFMKRHRNMLCGMPILEVDEVCDLLKMSDR
ncbi:DNA-binding protein, partial [Alistipes onderdonkii]